MTDFHLKRPLSTDSILAKKNGLCAMRFNSSRRVEFQVFEVSSNILKF